MKVLGYGFIVMLLLVCLAGCTHSPCSSQHKIALIHSYQRGYNNAERINRLFADELKKNGLQCEIKSYYLNCEKYGSTDEERRISGFIDDSNIWGADLIAVLDDQATYSLMSCNNTCRFQRSELPQYRTTATISQCNRIHRQTRLPQDLPDD